jgi:large subunit ribosomal protein L16
MLIPKKVKHRKWQKGRSRDRKIDTRGTELNFGKFGLKALESSWITSAQIESARKAISGHLKKDGRLWIRIFPDKPVTKKPPEVTMGGGKGSVDHYVFPVKPGRIIFEVDSENEDLAVDALKLASYKLPVKTKVIKKV